MWYCDSRDEHEHAISSLLAPKIKAVFKDLMKIAPYYFDNYYTKVFREVIQEGEIEILKCLKEDTTNE